MATGQRQTPRRIPRVAPVEERTLTDVQRNEAARARASDTGEGQSYDEVLVTGNGLSGIKKWQGDVVDTIAEEWLRINPDKMAAVRADYARLGGNLNVGNGKPKNDFQVVRDWVIRANGLDEGRALNCEGNYSLQPEIHRGTYLRVPEGNEITELQWLIPCEQRRAAPTPVGEAATEMPKATPPALEYYPFQATTQGGNNNGLVNSLELAAATGDADAVPYYLRPDVTALQGSKKTRRTGMDGDYHNQGPRKDDKRLSRVDNDAPRVTEERHAVQGVFYGGNSLTHKVDGRIVADKEAQSRFLNGDGFTGDDDRDLVLARGPLGLPMGFTTQKRNDLNIGQTSTTVSGAVMPTYTLSSKDFVNKDIWFINKPAQTSAPVATYDRVLAHCDYRLVSREFRDGSQSIVARLEGGDTTITRAEVQRVLNAGNYAQMNVLVRDAGIHHDLQSVIGDIHGRFQNYAWPANDQSPLLVLRNGASPDILDTPVAELGGYRMKVASRERFDELAREYGAGFRFDGFRGIEGQEMVGAYRVVHQRPTAVGQYIAENRSTLIRGDREATGQRTSAALNAVVGTGDAPNHAGVTALWNVAAGRAETASVLTNALSRAYNSPKEFGFKDQAEVEALVVGLTGMPSERQRNSDGIRGNNGDKGRNATDDAIGKSDGTAGAIPLVSDQITEIRAYFGNNEGRMIDPQAFARVVAPRIAADPALQAASANFLSRLPVADQVALLQTVGSDPRVDKNFGVPQALRELSAASGVSLDRQSVLFQGVVTAEVYSRSGYSEVTVSQRGYVNDALATFKARESGAPVVRSNVDMSDIDEALGRGDRTAAVNALLTGSQAVTSGAPQLVVESMRFNPALAANLVTATMLRDPQAFNEPIEQLRALDKQYTAKSLGIFDIDKFGQAAKALERSQERVAKLSPEVLEAARNGDTRALRRVEDAMLPWNEFTADMMNKPTSNKAHLRYAAYEQVWDAIGRDPRAQTAMAQTIASEPQFGEATIEILNLTRLHSVDMREEQFIGRRNGKGKSHQAIPQAVSGPAIDAAAGMYVSFGNNGRGKVQASINTAALVGPSTATVAASSQTVTDSAAAALAAGDTLAVATPAVADTPAASVDGQSAAAAATASGTPAANAATGQPAAGTPAASADGQPAAATAAASGTPAAGVQAAAPVVASIDDVFAAGAVLAASGTAEAPGVAAAAALPGSLGFDPKHLVLLYRTSKPPGDDRLIIGDPEGCGGVGRPICPPRPEGPGR